MKEQKVKSNESVQSRLSVSEKEVEGPKVPMCLMDWAISSIHKKELSGSWQDGMDSV